MTSPHPSRFSLNPTVQLVAPPATALLAWLATSIALSICNANPVFILSYSLNHYSLYWWQKPFSLTWGLHLTSITAVCLGLFTIWFTIDQKLFARRTAHSTFSALTGVIISIATMLVLHYFLSYFSRVTGEATTLNFLFSVQNWVTPCMPLVMFITIFSLQGWRGYAFCSALTALCLVHATQQPVFCNCIYDGAPVANHFREWLTLIANGWGMQPETQSQIFSAIGLLGYCAGRQLKLPLGGSKP